MKHVVISNLTAKKRPEMSLAHEPEGYGQVFEWIQYHSTLSKRVAKTRYRALDLVRRIPLCGIFESLDCNDSWKQVSREGIDKYDENKDEICQTTRDEAALSVVEDIDNHGAMMAR